MARAIPGYPFGKGSIPERPAQLEEDDPSADDRHYQERVSGSPRARKTAPEMIKKVIRAQGQGKDPQKGGPIPESPWGQPVTSHDPLRESESRPGQAG